MAEKQLPLNRIVSMKLKSEQQKGHAPDIIEMHTQTANEFCDQFGYSRRTFPLTYIGTMLGMRLCVNDALPKHLVLMKLSHEVVGVVDLTPEPEKPEFPNNPEKDTRINFASPSTTDNGYIFSRLDITREAIKTATIQSQRGGPYGRGPFEYVITITARATGKGMLMASFNDDPAGELQGVPKVDEGYVELAKR